LLYLQNNFFPDDKKKKKMIQNVWAQGRENKREKKYLLLRRDQWFWKVKPSFGLVRKLRLVRVTISIKSSCLLTCTCLLYHTLSSARISVNMCVCVRVCVRVCVCEWVYVCVSQLSWYLHFCNSETVFPLYQTGVHWSK
jgi:hypothetical protein